MWPALCLAPLALSPLLGPAPLPDDWPWWRGPQLDGVSREVGWSVEGRTLWSRDVGLGYSCASVAQGRVYTLGFDVEASQDVLFCLDAETGVDLWRYAWPARLRDQDHTGGTLSTPSVADGRVWIKSREGVVTCLDAEHGQVLWARTLPREVELSPNGYGFPSSPLLEGERVIVNADRAIALEKDSGEVLWASEPLDAQFSTPTVFELDGERRIASFGQQGLAVLDPASGEQLFFHPFHRSDRLVNASTPIVVGERLYISSAYDNGCALVEFSEGQARAVWANRRMRNKMAGGVLVGGHLFGFDESILKCLDLDGEELWRERGLGSGSLIGVGEHLFVLTSRGELIVAAASGTGFDELSRAKLFEQGEGWSPPVFAGGRAYVRSSLGQLVCRDHRAAQARADTSADAGAGGTGPLPPADELFRAHLAAVGGAEALERHDSMHVVGTFEMRHVGFTPVEYQAWWRAPNEWRGRIQAPGGRPGYIHRVFDGEVAYELNRYLGDKLLDPGTQLESPETRDFRAALHWERHYVERRTVALERLEGRPAWRVDARMAAGHARSVWFDRETGFLVRRASEDESIVQYGDYRAFEGRFVPTLEVHYRADTGIQETFRIDSVEFDSPEVEDALFERPESVEELIAAGQEEADGE